MFYLTAFVAGLALADFAGARISLGTADQFGIVASSAITNTGATIVTGKLGLNPNADSSITGFPLGISGTVHAGDAVAQQTHADASTAYTQLAGLSPTESLVGQDLGGLTLFSGVYNFPSSGGLTGQLTLDAQGNSNALFVFQFGSTLTTATASSVILINGAQACNVFWQVGSSATLGTTTSFLGNILAQASITLNGGVTVQGGLYAITAAVTLIDDTVTAIGSCDGIVTTSSSTTTTQSSTTSSTTTASTTTTAATTTTASTTTRSTITKSSTTLHKTTWSTTTKSSTILHKTVWSTTSPTWTSVATTTATCTFKAS